MRLLTDHATNPANEALSITVLDEPGQGGACHEYEIDLTGGAPTSGGWKCLIKFQNGPIKEFGVNGITQEALLAIVIDRLKSFQAGPFKCHENAMALTSCEAALDWLLTRTRERRERGVEGVYQP